MFNIFSNVIVQSWLDMEWFVWLLNLFDPHIQGVKFFFDEVVEVIRCVKDTVNGTHKEGEEGEAQEFKTDGEDVLVWGLTGIVTITNGCNNFKDPIECEDVLRYDWLAIETFSIDPRLSTILLTIIAGLEHSKDKPDTGHEMTCVDDVQNETGETCQIILSLLWVFL